VRAVRLIVDNNFFVVISLIRVVRLLIDNAWLLSYNDGLLIDNDRLRSCNHRSENSNCHFTTMDFAPGRRCAPLQMGICWRDFYGLAIAIQHKLTLRQKHLIEWLYVILIVALEEHHECSGSEFGLGPQPIAGQVGEM